ncbi:MAG: 4Fe-4S dicluster domain-containing protein, partial [Candidatus Bathyarchaeota archaeon]|nr:4Fe-4S dicluster domain-containing protein [Candidatus Bathyarchaeota archaeon]
MLIHLLNNNAFTIIVNWNRCSGEGTCTKICPVDVFELQELKDYPETLKSVPVNPQNCTYCMKCVP